MNNNNLTNTKKVFSNYAEKTIGYFSQRRKTAVINSCRGLHESSDTLGHQRPACKMKRCNEELNACNGSERTEWKITNHWHHNSPTERLFCLHFVESRQFRRWFKAGAEQRKVGRVETLPWTRSVIQAAFFKKRTKHEVYFGLCLIFQS